MRRSLLTATIFVLSIKGAAEDSSLLSASDRESIELVLSPREEILAMFKGIEATEIAFETNNNAHVALQMLGEDDRAYQLAAELYSRFPNAPSILRAATEKRMREGQWESAKNDLIARLPTLSNACRAGIGELAMQSGHLAWFAACKLHPAVEPTDVHFSELMSLLEILTRWKCGDKATALKDMNSLAASNPNSVSVIVALSKLEAQHGLREQALTRLRQAVLTLLTDGKIRERLSLADGLFDLKAFDEVVDLLSDLVKAPRDDVTTRRLIESLIRSGQLQRATTLIESLPSADRTAVAVRRFEMELAHQIGDFDALAVLLEQELKQTPKDAVIATNYAGILLALDRVEDLSRFLAANPQFKNSHPKHIFEFAKIEINCGFAANGHARLYELWRAHPNDSFVAQCFFVQQMLNIDEEILRAEKKASGSFAAKVSNSGVESWIAVDKQSARNGAPWPECIASSEDFARNLLAANVGDIVEQRGGFFPVQVKVLGFFPIRRFALEKARALVETNSSPNRTVQSINIDSMGMDKFVQSMTAMAYDKERAVGRALALYKNATHERPFFLNCLMRLLNTDEYGLVHDWPYNYCRMQISTGEIDRQAAMRHAFGEATAITVDVVTLVELQRISALEILLRNQKDVLVPRAVVEQLRYLRMLHAPGSGSAKHAGTFGTYRGKPFFTEGPSSEEVVADLDAIRNFINSHCKIVPVIGPKVLTDVDRALTGLLDTATANVVRLCSEREIPLVTIDSYLGETLFESLRIQPIDLPFLIGETQRAQLLSSESRATMLAKLVDAGRSFIGTSASDLFFIANNTPLASNNSAERLIRVCEGKGVDITNAFTVMHSFFKHAAKSGIAPRVVGHYAFVFRNAVKSAKRAYWTPLEIDNRIIDDLEQIYGKNGEKLKGTERVAMQRVLTRKPLLRFIRSPLL